MRSNQCVIACVEMLHVYLTGKKLSNKVAVEYVEAEEGNPAIEGATFLSGLKALRKLGLKFTYRAISKLTSTRSLEKKMLIVADFESYVEPHAVLLYREHGVIYLLDCLQPTGAYMISEEHALRLIKRSDETFVVSRL